MSSRMCPLVFAFAALAVETHAGTLKLSWKDCGAAHGKVTGLTPATVTLGQKTTATGSGSIDEAVSSGSFNIDVSAGIIKKQFTGDICQAKTFPLPLGTGSVTFDGLKCPVAAGNVNIPIDILLSSAIPSSLAKATITVKATAGNGDALLCMEVDTSPESTSVLNVNAQRVAQIHAIESTQGVHWKAGVVERFASQAPNASKSLCGVKDGWQDEMQKAISSGEVARFQHDETLAVPDSFDSETNWPECAEVIGDIRDQSACGCCWAFAGAEAASDRMCIATKAAIKLPLSAEDVCFCASSDGCDGGMINTPWEYIKNGGAVTGGQYKGSGPFGAGMCSDFSLPHCHHHGPQGNDPYPAEGTAGCPSQSSPSCPSQCDSSAQAPHNDFQEDKYSYTGETQTASGETEIQQMIMTGGPVETAFTVYSDFENYVGGIYHHVSGGVAGGHAVKMVGWGSENGVKYWKVANSWNPYWGEKGYFRIVRGTNEGGIENQVIGASATAKWAKRSELSTTAAASALTLTWKDCGDSTTHGKVTGLTPSVLTLGQKTKVTGTGSLEEQVTAGTFQIELKAGIIKKQFTGSISSAQTFNLPLGTGSITWDGLKCPIASGSVNVPLDILLSAAIPPSLAKSTITVTATSSSGDKLICMEVDTTSASDNYAELIV